MAFDINYQSLEDAQARYKRAGPNERKQLAEYITAWQGLGHNPNDANAKPRQGQALLEAAGDPVVTLPETEVTAPSIVSMAQSPRTLVDRQQALLDAIAGKESRGKYNIGFGGTTITDMSRHPGQSLAKPITRGPNAGKTSSAAGRYQFMEKDWKEWSAKTGAADFSPRSQDMNALAMAGETYKRKTGRDLDADLMSDDPKIWGGIGKSLSGRWTSLPGGIEANQTEEGFAKAMEASLAGEPQVEGSANGSPYERQVLARAGVTPYQEWTPQAQPSIAAEQALVTEPVRPNTQVQKETPEQMRERLKIAQEYVNKNEKPPGYGDMGHYKAGYAGLANPNYEDMGMYAQQAMPSLIQMLLQLKGLGGQEEYKPFYGAMR